MTAADESCFLIDFVGERFVDEGQDIRCIRLRLGSYKEESDACLTCWDEDEYRLRWRQGLEEVLSPIAKSALITSLPDPDCERTIELWPMWRIGRMVFFQNMLLFTQEAFDGFSPDRLARFIGDRREVNEEGQPLSEWLLDVSCLERFLMASDSQLKGSQKEGYFA